MEIARNTRAGILPLLLASALQAQWYPVSTPSKEYMLELAAFGDTLFACGNDLYRSIDRGETWKNVGGALGGGNKLSVLRKGGALFVSVYENGVYRSHDRGATWTPAASGLGSNMVIDLKADGRDLYVSTDFRGLYRSEDEGASWTSAIGDFPGRQNPDSTTRYEISDYIVSGGRIFAGTSRDGLFRSTDRGSTWVSVEGLPTGEVQALCQAGSSVFAAMGTQVHRTRDEGRTWERVGAGILDREVWSLTFSSGSLYAGTKEGSYVSADLGTTWKALSGFPSDPPQITDLLWLGDTCMAASSAGLFRSLDRGLSWTQHAAGTRSGGISALLSAGSSLFASLTREPFLFRTGNLGRAWEKAGENPPAQVRSLLLADGLIYAGTDGGVLRSGDAGRTWQEAGLKGLPVNQMLGGGGALFAMTRDSVHRSADRGETWIEVSSDLPDPGLGSSLRHMAANGADLFAISLPQGIWRSRNSGDTWELLPGSDTLEAKGLAFAGGSLLAYGGKGIHRSDDAGRTWIRTRLPDAAGQVLTVLAVNAHLFAGTSQGLAHSPDGGMTWKWAESEWAPDLSVLAQDATHLFGGSQAYGLWRRPLSEFMIPTATPGHSRAANPGRPWQGRLRPGMAYGRGPGNRPYPEKVVDLKGRRLRPGP